MLNLSMIIQGGRFHDWRPGRNAIYDRVITTVRRRLNSGTVLVNAQPVWDNLIAEEQAGDDRPVQRESIPCPRPPEANMWLEAVTSDGRERRTVGALVAAPRCPAFRCPLLILS
jgi:hypothetical protein